MRAFGWMKLSERYRPEALRVSAEATYLGDNTKPRIELGYNPRTLREGLKETLAVEMADLNMVATTQEN